MKIYITLADIPKNNIDSLLFPFIHRFEMAAVCMTFNKCFVKFWGKMGGPNLKLCTKLADMYIPKSNMGPLLFKLTHL